MGCREWFYLRRKVLKIVIQAVQKILPHSKEEASPNREYVNAVERRRGKAEHACLSSNKMAVWTDTTITEPVIIDNYRENLSKLADGDNIAAVRTCPLSSWSTKGRMRTKYSPARLDGMVFGNAVQA